MRPGDEGKCDECICKECSRVFVCKACEKCEQPVFEGDCENYYVEELGEEEKDDTAKDEG